MSSDETQQRLFTRCFRSERVERAFREHTFQMSKHRITALALLIAAVELYAIVSRNLDWTKESMRMTFVSVYCPFMVVCCIGLFNMSPLNNSTRLPMAVWLFAAVYMAAFVAPMSTDILHDRPAQRPDAATWQKQYADDVEAGRERPWHDVLVRAPGREAGWVVGSWYMIAVLTTMVGDSAGFSPFGSIGFFWFVAGTHSVCMGLAFDFVPGQGIALPPLAPNCTAYWALEGACNETAEWACPSLASELGTVGPTDDGSLGFHCCCNSAPEAPAAPQQVVATCIDVYPGDFLGLLPHLMIAAGINVILAYLCCEARRKAYLVTIMRVEQLSREKERLEYERRFAEMRLSASPALRGAGSHPLEAGTAAATMEVSVAATPPVAAAAAAALDTTSEPPLTEQPQAGWQPTLSESEKSSEVELATLSIEAAKSLNVTALLRARPTFSVLFDQPATAREVAESARGGASGDRLAALSTELATLRSELSGLRRAHARSSGVTAVAVSASSSSITPARATTGPASDSSFCSAPRAPSFASPPRSAAASDTDKTSDTAVELHRACALPQGPLPSTRRRLELRRPVGHRPRTLVDISRMGVRSAADQHHPASHPLREFVMALSGQRPPGPMPGQMPGPA